MKLILLFCLFSLTVNAQTGFIQGKPKIAWWKYGESDEVVIVLHGGPGATHDYLRPEWDRVAEFSTLIYYDQRGNGLSEEANCYSWREHINDLHRLIKQISPDRKVILAGSSWGNELAILFAHFNPNEVKGIILSGLVAWHGRGWKQKDCSQYRYIEIEPASKAQMEDLKAHFESLKSSSNKMDTIPLFSEKESNLINEKNINVSDKVSVETINSLNDAPEIKEINLSVPLIIFQGTENCHYKDVSNEYSDISSEIEIIYIDESCHDPWIVDPEAFFEKFQKFIEKLSLVSK